MEYYLDPELAAMFAGGFPRTDLADLATARKNSAAARERLPRYESRRAVTVTDVVLPGYQRDDGVGGRLYRPDGVAGPLPGLIYLFGGAFALGSIDAIDGRARQIVDRVDVTVLTVAYRRAPEHPYPAALDDAYAALLWISGAPDIDPARVGVLGESAGGGLAAALALITRDRGGPRLIAQFLDAPTIDDRLTSRSIRTLTDVPVWQPRNSLYSWRYYLRGTAEPGAAYVPIYAAPARASVDALAGLPPAYVTSYEVDPTRDEGLDYGVSLIRAGVPTELHSYPGAVHVTHSIPGTAIGARMTDDRMAAIERLLKPGAFVAVVSES
ncbi:acetyl esterase/lipase [Asanoa ferruginea]|uniref:Acetyl esterase/lipase n=1 Tax=Asanoa ferruginea TaxID=53367 RepID=A0A3D9ZNJ6_9ACTN|nr:alpha/beta hydrolase fold domain-containing protein [Asanoa ferruginea]REF98194.1 acetyl esterase/lipase [Asanoa ferruginea]GIF50836.1 esterase [Asanoa ferruginea]